MILKNTIVFLIVLLRGAITHEGTHTPRHMEDTRKEGLDS